MKKFFVKALSLSLAIITLLIASMIPVSAANTQFNEFKKTIYASQHKDTSMDCVWFIQFTPNPNSNREYYEKVNSGATLHVGATNLDMKTKYFVIRSVVTYTDGSVDMSTRVKKIGRGYANQSINSIVPGSNLGTQNVDPSKNAKNFYSYQMVSYLDEPVISKECCVEDLYFEQQKYYLQVHEQ